MSGTARLLIRLIAWVYDVLLVGVPLFVASVTVFHISIYAIFFFIAAFIAYAVVTPVATSGFTLGKRLLRIQIVIDDTKRKWKALFLRHLFVPILYFITCGILLLISMIMIKVRYDQRGLHDVLAKTNVILLKK